MFLCLPCGFILSSLYGNQPNFIAWKIFIPVFILSFLLGCILLIGNGFIEFFKKYYLFIQPG